jgi:putative effector of murein hydrolase
VEQYLAGGGAMSGIALGLMGIITSLFFALFV